MGEDVNFAPSPRRDKMHERNSFERFEGWGRVGLLIGVGVGDEY